MSALKQWVLEKHIAGGIDENFENNLSRFRQQRTKFFNAKAGREPHWRPERWTICREGRPGWWMDEDRESDPRRRDRMHFDDALNAIKAYRASKSNAGNTVRMRNLVTGDIIMGDIIAVETFVDPVTGTTMFK